MVQTASQPFEDVARQLESAMDRLVRRHFSSFSF